jgi:hypothetical protein
MDRVTRIFSQHWQNNPGRKDMAIKQSTVNLANFSSLPPNLKDRIQAENSIAPQTVSTWKEKNKTNDPNDKIEKHKMVLRYILYALVIGSYVDPPTDRNLNKMISEGLDYLEVYKEIIPNGEGQDYDVDLTLILHHLNDNSPETINIIDTFHDNDVTIVHRGVKTLSDNQNNKSPEDIKSDIRKYILNSATVNMNAYMNAIIKPGGPNLVDILGPNVTDYFKTKVSSFYVENKTLYYWGNRLKDIEIVSSLGIVDFQGYDYKNYMKELNKIDMTP